MKMLVIGALCWTAQTDDGGPFFRFTEGTKWVYEELVRKGEKTFRNKSTQEVKQAEETKTILKCRWEQDPGEQGLEVSHEGLGSLGVREGFLVMGEADDHSDEIRVLRLGAKKEDSWKSRGFLAEECEATYRGTAEVKVRAGIYKDALEIHFRGQVPGPDGKPSAFTYRCFLVPKVGLVKLEFKAEGVSITKELVEFAEKK